MAASPISPIAPARVWVLVHPIGNVTEARFQSFVDRLLPENVVRLSDISPDARPGRTTFSPLAFPNGVILYKFDTSRPDAKADKSLFELFRRPLVVIGIFDAIQHEASAVSVGKSEAPPDAFTFDYAQAIAGGVEQLQAENPDVLVVQPVIFDLAASAQKTIPPSVLTVPPPIQSRSTTMKTVMCDVSARLLSEMAVFAQSVQALDHIISPGSNSTAYTSAVHHISSVTDNSGAFGSGTPRPNSASGPRPGPQNAALPRNSESDVRPSSMDFSASQSYSRSSSPTPISESADKHDAHMQTDKNRPASKAANRTGMENLGRDSSRDRRSKQANALHVAERAKQKLACRQGLVVGTVYLLAGRWSDALRELIIHTGRAKIFGDQIWYGKGLECILATMLLLSWARLEFAVPSICLPGSDRMSNMKQSIPSSLVRSSQSIDGNADGNDRTLIDLAAAIPELVRMITDAYQPNPDVQEDRLPQLPLSECIIRLSYLLAILYRSGGMLNQRSLSHIAQGARWSSRVTAAVGSSVSASVAQEISTTLFDALPSELFSSSAPLSETITILSGMISVLSFAGLYRKRAMLVRETLSVLIPKLIQARKVGAAELGIHPAASLAARHGLNIDSSSGTSLVSQGQVEQGFHNLLTILCDTYGVVTNGESGALKANGAHGEESERLKLFGNVSIDSKRRQFGGFGLKSDVLRLCANFSEALPNFADVIHFTASLIKTAGPGDAPSFERFRPYVRLPSEEQKRFLGKIHRTLGVFKDADASQLEAEYWDPFAVRAIEVVSLPEGQAITCRKVTGLRSTSAAASGPFLYNPTDQAASRLDVPNVIIAKEPAVFAVTLQNLYDFDVLVERLFLVSEQGELNAAVSDITLRASKLQKVHVNGTVDSPGDVRILGCRMKFQGCREDMQPIYSESWSPGHPIKVKRSGLQAIDRAPLRSGSSEDNARPANEDGEQSRMPTPTTVSLKVTDQVPSLMIEASALLQDRLALMEGETRAFALMVRNISEDISIDFIQISFEHSFASGVTLGAGKHAAAASAEVPEPMRCINPQAGPKPMNAGSASTFSFEVFAARKLVASKIIIDYGFIGATNHSTFYTRSVSCTVETLVWPSIEAETIIALPRSIASSSTLHGESAVHEATLSFDMKNESETRMTASIWDKDAPSEDKTTTEMQPQEKKRILVSLLLEIPKSQNDNRKEGLQLNGSPKQDRHLPKVEQLRNLLNTRLFTQWEDIASGRRGTIDLSKAYIDTPHSDLLLDDQSTVHLSIMNPAKEPLEPFAADGEYSIPRNEPVILQATFKNRTTQAVTPVFHLHPRMSGSLAADVSRSLTWSGSLESIAKVVQPSDTASTVLGLCATSSGVFDIEVLVTQYRQQPHIRGLGISQGPESQPKTSGDHVGAAQERTYTQEGSNKVLGSAVCTLRCSTYLDE